MVAAMVTLAFTLPTHSAGPVDGCAEGPHELHALDEVRLYQLGQNVPEQHHVAGPLGSRDSFRVDVSDGAQRTYYVTCTNQDGAESCPSNWITLNGGLDAPVYIPERLRWYDVAGREVAGPARPGVYWWKQGRKAGKVVSR
jgi:hypothetical protein